MNWNDSRRPADLSWLVAIFFAVVWLAFIPSRGYSSNDASRLASIESLVHRGAWVIDHSPFAHTIDKIKVGDHFYSDKPPLLSFVGAGLYAALHHGLGLTLQPDGCPPGRGPTVCRALFEAREADWAYVLLTLLLVALPGVLILVLVYRFARHQGLGNGVSLLVVALLALGTALFPFSVVLLNHTPAAAALTVALYLLLTRNEARPSIVALVGFCAALAVSLDLSAGLFAAGLFFYVLWRDRRQVGWFILGGAAPLLATAVLNMRIVGNPLPPQFYAAGYQYEGSVLYGNLSGFSRADNVLRYTFDMLFGRQAVFGFYPILLWFTVGAGTAVQAGETKARWLAIMTLTSILLYVAYFALSTDNFGGFAYSPRWLLIPVPLLVMLSLINPRLYHSRRSLIVAAGLGVLSLLSAHEGALNPWRSGEPLLQLSVTRPAPPAYHSAAVSGYPSFTAVDPVILQGFDSDIVIRRWFDARFGFVVVDGLSYYFLHDATPLDPALADWLNLSFYGETALRADLRPMAERALAQMESVAYQATELAPTSEVELIPRPLPVGFSGEDGRMALRGYHWRQTADELTLITGWQIEDRSQYLPADRRVFVHLLTPGGEVASQSDFMAADYGTLFPGDIFFQIQRLPLTGLSPGRYWLQLGLYQPQTGGRFLTTAGEERLIIGYVTID